MALLAWLSLWLPFETGMMVSTVTAIETCLGDPGVRGARVADPLKKTLGLESTSLLDKGAIRRIETSE